MSDMTLERAKEIDSICHTDNGTLVRIDPFEVTDALRFVLQRLETLERHVSLCKTLIHCADKGNLYEAIERKLNEKAGLLDELEQKERNASAMRGFAERVSRQKPEKPEYVIPCHQCGQNIEDAQELLEGKEFVRKEQG